MFLFTLLLVPLLCQGNQLRRRTFIVPDQRFLQRDEFIDGCTRDLTSGPIAQDSIISQVEYASLIVTYCTSPGADCDVNPGAGFTNLPLPLQTAFVSVACTQFDNVNDCIKEFMGQFGDTGNFGYSTDGQTEAEVEEKVTLLCSVVYATVVDTSATGKFYHRL